MSSDIAAAETEKSISQVVLSFPDELSDWGRDQIATDRYRGYLRRVLETPSVGDEFEEFVDVGCCGNTLDVTFRIEEVRDGTRVTDDTAIELVERSGTVEGGWRVQSAAAPE